MYWANSRRITAVQRIYARFSEREEEKEEEEEDICLPNADMICVCTCVLTPPPPLDIKKKKNKTKKLFQWIQITLNLSEHIIFFRNVRI